MYKHIKIKHLKSLLKSKSVNHNKNILKLDTLKKVHIYSKINGLTGQTYGPLIESYIINKYELIKNKSSECIGDCSKIYQVNGIDNDYVNVNKKNFEIKVSLGGYKHNKFNYVQLRFNHNIDYYILTAYYLCHENVKKRGDLFVFIVGKNELKNIVFKYGNYAHGTLNKNGKRTFESMNNDDLNEYALRPTYGDNCWNELLEFKVNNNNIFEKLDEYFIF
jgi:hypothetical protein